MMEQNIKYTIVEVGLFLAQILYKNMCVEAMLSSSKLNRDGTFHRWLGCIIFLNLNLYVF